MSPVHSISKVEMSYMRQKGTHLSRQRPGAMDKAAAEVRTHSEDQGRNGSAASGMNHGKKTEEVAFPRPGKKQSVRETQRWFGVQVITEAAAQTETDYSSGDWGVSVGGQQELRDRLLSWDHLSRQFCT